jgi:hypothetical protein
MQSVQRQIGRYMKRSADESQVSVPLKDFEDADLLLAKVSRAPQKCYAYTGWQSATVVV